MLTYQIQTAAEIAANGAIPFIVPALEVTQSEVSCEMGIEVQYCDLNRDGDIIVDENTVWDEAGGEPCIWQPVALSGTTQFVNQPAEG